MTADSDSDQDDPKGFAMMPRWIQRDPRISAAAKLVYLALSSRVGRSGSAFPSHRQLAQDASCSVPTVKRALAELRALEVVSWDRQWRGENNSQTVNIYTISVSRAPAQTELPPAHSELPPSSDRATPQLTQTQGVAHTELLNESHINESHINESHLSKNLLVCDADGGDKRDDVDGLCNLLVELIVENGVRRPTITDRWRDAARLLIDHDGISRVEVERILRWSQRDPFWRSNILSMPKLREKFDQLRLRAVGILEPDTDFVPSSVFRPAAATMCDLHDEYPLDLRSGQCDQCIRHPEDRASARLIGAVA